MEESQYTKNVLDSFNKKFPQGWIDNLDWNPNKQVVSYQGGVKSIQEFKLLIFVDYSRLVLSAEYLKYTTSIIEDLDAALVVEEIIPEENPYKRKLQNLFFELCAEVHDLNLLLKYHIDATKNRFKPQVKRTIINAITSLYDDVLYSRKHSYLPLFQVICDSCWSEFNFSFNDNYVTDLVVKRQRLIKQNRTINSVDIKNIVQATIDKLTFLLEKLSVFYEDREIAYMFDLKPDSITLTSPNLFEPTDFRSHFMQFIDVNQITHKEIYEWQQESHNEDTYLWKFILLMRYYVKKAKSKQQIDNLLKDFEKQNEATLKKDINTNLVNEYSCRLAKNYMYNSRFSFLCKCYKKYTVDLMIQDLNSIGTIQQETAIYNYHPYQKAIEFLLEKLSAIVRKSTDVDKAKEYIALLKECYEKYLLNVDWCKEHQPYYIQSRYNFSTIKLGSDKTIDVFCPSSFCRPLKFKEIDEKAVQFRNDIAFLNYQVEHMDDRVEWLEAKEKVERLERKNLETMGLFVTITTFLVGMLAIFIGNNNVSIFNKIQYTSVLGMVLMLFVCLGYFVVTDNIRGKRSWFFGIFAFLLVIAIIVAYCKSYFGALPPTP